MNNYFQFERIFSKNYFRVKNQFRSEANYYQLLKQTFINIF